ncbi:MAG: response regulator transcription factor [Ruminococcus sp.]|nr:response regulator transcription factor [Ruminococcus sp.]
MNVAICDDEKIWQSELIDNLNEYKKMRKIDIFIQCFSDGESCCEAPNDKYDIIFMDYQMENSNGIETARKIRKTNSDSIIIFVSAYPQVAMDTFEVKTFRFLSKPIDKAKLFKAIDDYLKEFDVDSFLIFKTHEKTIRIKMSEIIYAEAQRNHTIIHTEKEDFEILKNLKAVEKMLPKDRFFRCHNAYITSLYHVKKHSNTEVCFDDNSVAYISRSMLTKFKKAFHEFIKKHDLGEIK